MKQSKFIYQDNENFALRTVGIKKSYGKNQVLKGINIEVKKGERVALLGRNGSGKSTFISLITQQRAFHEGTIVYGYADTKSKALELLGVQFQNLSYPEGFFVKDVLKLFQSAVPLGIRLTKQQLEDLIDLFGIKPYLKQRIDKLSGGQQQRVNIILSLIKRPKLLILDEISSGLDVKSSTDIKNYIKKYLQLDKEVSLIIVSHNIAEVKELTKTSYVLKDGLIAESFPSKNLNLAKFMDIVSVDIDYVTKNIQQAKKAEIIKEVSDEYEKVKNSYIDDLEKRHDKFIHSLDFREVYRLQEELVELKSVTFKTKLVAKIDDKTKSNKEKDQKELTQDQKELTKNPLYKKIQINEEKLQELNSKEFIIALFKKLEPKHKKDRKNLKKDLEERKATLDQYIKERPISALDNIITAIEKELVNLNNQKKDNSVVTHDEFTKIVSEKILKHDQGLEIKKSKELSPIDKEILQANINIKNLKIMKKEIASDTQKETKKIDHDERHFENHVNRFIKADKDEILRLVKVHIAEINNELAAQTKAINQAEKNLKTKNIDFNKKYKKQIVEDKKLSNTIIKTESDLRVEEILVLQKNLTTEQDGISIKQHEYNKDLIFMQQEIPSKVAEKEKIVDKQKVASDKKIAAHDKSYEDSWTNDVYDFLDKEKVGFNIKPPKEGNIVEIRHLSKNFKHLKAVRNFNLEIKDGDRVAITGPNGSGKSTIISMLTQLVKPNSGEIAYSFGKTKRSVVNNVGVQFQNSSFPQEMSVFDVVIFFARANRYSLTRNEIRNALKVFKLDDLQKQKAYLLSGGEKQRLNVLLALIKKPKLVILDEISTGLDIDSIHKINGYVKEYLDKSGATLIIVSHNYEEIHNLANKLVILNHGIKTEEDNIVNWTEDQVKAKMFEVFSISDEDLEEDTNIDDDKFVYTTNFKEAYRLQDEIDELTSSAFKIKLTNKIAKTHEAYAKKEQKTFESQEKELEKNPIYQKLESNESKLIELNSKEFSDILYTKLDPKHKKDSERLQLKLKNNKKDLKKYIGEHPTDDLDKLVADLKKQLETLKTKSVDPKLEKNELVATKKELAQVKIEIKKINAMKKEIVADIAKQLKIINYDESHLEANLNKIIKKDKTEITSLVTKHIEDVSSDIEQEKKEIAKYEKDFRIVKKTFNKNNKNQILKEKELVETIIEAEIVTRVNELSVLGDVLTKEQNGKISKKNKYHEKIPHLSKSISIWIGEIKKTEEKDFKTEVKMSSKGGKK